jgi:hypothetical protein
MKKIFTLFINVSFFSLAVTGIFAQGDENNIPELKKLWKSLPVGLNIKNNPFENVPEMVKRTKPFQRERWFYEQRMYPYNYIPQNAYSNSLLQKSFLETNYMAVPWVSIKTTQKLNSISLHHIIFFPNKNRNLRDFII